MQQSHLVKDIGSSRFCFFLMPLLLSVLLMLSYTPPAYSAPEGGVVRAGTAQIIEDGNRTLIQQSSNRAIIDWRGFSIKSDEQVRFAQPSVKASTLNRVTGSQISNIQGRLDANGQVLLINPNGIIFGKGAQINVGSLIASTADLSNDNFMQGKLVFDQPGKPGASIQNAGRITAAEGGLVALVAPHVRNDGLIQARLGRVLMGSADTFTIDLYGDGLMNLVLNEDSLAQLKNVQGEAVESLIKQAGTIDVDGGKAVLITAEAARGVMDSLINMSGTILADSAVQEGGRIHLLARGGGVDVSGELSAKGTTGGKIEVLGDQVNLASTASLSVDGTNGGGTLHVGGAFQGGGDTYRSRNTKIDSGAVLKANALDIGHGGEVIVWSDGHTSYAGTIEARGGKHGGDGGFVEVSGKQTLTFNGLVNADARNGNPGLLLLDPWNFTIGRSEASLINRVLRTGTSTSISADNNINVDYAIDGRGRYKGGGLTLSAGNNINVNDYIITNNGAINLYAGRGTVNLAPGKMVYAGNAPITVRSGADLYNAPYLTGGLLSLISSKGSVFINQAIDASIGNLYLDALEDVEINEPIVNISTGGYVNVKAGRDITLGAQVDGRPSEVSSPLGSVAMTVGGDVHLNSSIIANSINLKGMGTIHAPTMTAGTVTLDGSGIPRGDGLFSGTGPISVTAGGDLSSGIYVTYGPVLLRSTGGNVYVDTKIAEILGDVTISSDTGSVHVDQEIANIRSGSSLAVMAGQDINLNRQIDALDDTNPLSITPVPGGRVTFVAGNNVNLNEDLVTYDGAADISALAGTLNIAWNGAEDRTYRVQSGSAPISVTTGGDLSTGPAPSTSITIPDPDVFWENYNNLNPDEDPDPVEEIISNHLKRYVALVTTGKLSLSSTGGNVTVDAPIPGTTGGIELNAANAIVVNHKVFSDDQPVSLTAGAGGIVVNTTDDNYGIYRPDGVAVANPSPSIDSGAGDLTLRAGGDIDIETSKGIATSGKLTIDTDSKILQGLVSVMVPYVPSEIELVAVQGIDSFQAGSSPKISATSSEGAIHLSVDKPGQLFISAPSPTAGDVYTGGWIGEYVDIHAGRNIYLTDTIGGVIKLYAGNNAFLNTFYVTSLDVDAEKDINFSSPSYLNYPDSTVWITNGDLIATSRGGDINFGSEDNYSAIHIENGKSLILHADGSVSLGLLEVLGDVSITAENGNIALRNDIGAPIQFYRPSSDTYYKEFPDVSTYDELRMIYGEVPAGTPSFDPDGVGPASIYLYAGNDIFIQGANASGEVTIFFGGNLTPARGIFSGKENGVSIFKIEGDATESYFKGSYYGDTPLPIQGQLQPPSLWIPAIMPGPSVAPPGMPMALTALPAQPPGLANVSGSGIPGASGGDESFSESEIESVEVGGSFTLTEIIPEEEEEDEDEEERKKTLHFSGGRGEAWSVNLGSR